MALQRFLQSGNHQVSVLSATDEKQDRGPTLDSQIKVPLVTNGHSISVIDEHCGQVFFAKWNPANGRRFCATGGAGDYFVDIWDFDTIRNQASIKPPVPTRPLLQLRHISVTKSDADIPARESDNHFISSI